MNLVVIPFHDWKKCEREGFRTRDAHLMQEFSKHPFVDNLLIINRPISLSEIILFRRNWRIKKGKLLAKKNGIYLSQVAPKTFTLDIIIPEIIRPIMMRRNWVPYIFNHSKVVKAVSFALDYLNMEHNYALFMSAPLFVPLIKNISPKVWGMDAQDNLLKHAIISQCKKITALLSILSR